MIHVFHVISKFDLGGAERVALNISKSSSCLYQYHLIEVAKLRSRYSSDFIQEAIDSNVLVHESPVSNVKLAAFLFPFWFLLLYIKCHPSIIHVHTEIPDFGVRLFYSFFGFFVDKSTILCRTVHSTQQWNGWSSVGSWVEKKYVDNQRNIAISASVKKKYEERFHVSGLPIVYNGISEVGQIRYEGIKKGRCNILFAGRLSEEKGVTELIAVVKHFVNDNRFWFHIVGSGAMSVDINQAFSSANNVTIRDAIYNISRYLGSFDYVLMPSHFEGFGLMSVECSFSKTPCIINDCSGLRETLPGDWPLVVPNNSVSKYIEIIENLIIQNERNLLSQRAFDYVISRFTLSKMQEGYETLYRQWLKDFSKQI